MASWLEDALLRGLLTVLEPSNHVTQEPAFNIWLFVEGGIQIKKYSIGVFCYLFICKELLMFYLFENFKELFWAWSHRSPLLCRLPDHPTSCSHSLSNKQVKALYLLVGQKNQSKQEKSSVPFMPKVRSQRKWAMRNRGVGSIGECIWVGTILLTMQVWDQRPSGSMRSTMWSNDDYKVITETNWFFFQIESYLQFSRT